MERLSTAKKSPDHHNNNNNDTTSRSIFTPILTPSGGGTAMVLLSPSRTITETLTSLASTTGRQLEEIWDEVGYSPEERAAELSDLLVKFRDICEHKIAEEQRFAETYRQTIAEAKEEIRLTGAALKLETDSQLLSDAPTQTLIDELATLEASLEGLRTAATTAKEDLKECLAYLVEAHEALGLIMDPSWQDIESDLTARRREQFHNKKAEMKEELSTRTAAVVQLVRDCQQLMEDLRMEPEKDGSELDRRIAGSLVRSKDGSFIMASKFRSDTCIGISSQALEELTRHVALLHGEKRRRKEKLQEMGGEIAILWEKLRVPEEEQSAFTKSVQGLGTDTIQKGEMELKRLHSLKSEMLGNLIYEARETIRSLWEQTNATPECLQIFTAFNVQDEDLFDDELLEKHDDYIGTLQARLEQMKPILRLIERREAVLRDRIEYEDLQKDSDRLKQRGAAMTKQLMAEEKMAKRIKRDLPKLTETLTETLAEWKQVHDEDFQYKGHVYLDVMARQEEEWKQYKAEEMHRKLKKKQEEKAFVDNRMTAQNPAAGPSKKRPTKPLADSTSSHNIEAVQQQQPSKKLPLPSKARTQSHDVSKVAVPVRSLGEKHPSTKF
jgi:Ase1/PRC1/MAP65 family protein